jgi:hypothetical protein
VSSFYGFPPLQAVHSCNNNSISPPTTTIGVLGGDHLLANILKAYVHLLQDKVRGHGFKI